MVVANISTCAICWFGRKHHQRGLTELVSIPTDFQLADPLTKVLAGPAVTKFRSWALRGVLPSDLPAL